MASKWIPLRSKIQNWILCLLIQVLTTIQIAFLALVFLFLFGFVYEDPFPVLGIPALGSTFFMSICLVSCILMEKVSLDYWKWKEEKTGRVLFQLCYVIGMVRYFNILHISQMKETADYRHINEAFFHRNPKLLGMDRQYGPINFGTFTVFWADFLVTILVQSLDYVFIIQPLFLQKN